MTKYRRRLLRVGVATALAVGLVACQREPARQRSEIPSVSLGAIATVADVRGGLSWWPAVASDPTSDRVYVAWTSFPNDTDTEVHLAVSDDGGATFGTPIRLGARSEQAPVMQVAGGILFVAWTHWDPTRRTDPKDQYSNPSWQLLETSTDGGRTFSDPVAVPSGRPLSTGYFMTMTVTPDAKNVLLAWFDYTSTPTTVWPGRDATTMFAARSTDGGQTFSAPQQIADATCVCCSPSAFFLDTNPGVLYRNFHKGGTTGDVRDPAVVMADAAGSGWNDPVIVHDDGFRLKVCPHMGLGAAAGTDGTLHVDWWTGAAGREGYWYTTSTNGRTFSDPIQLAPLATDPHGNDLNIAIDGDGTTWMPAVLFPDKRDGSAGSPTVALWAATQGAEPVRIPVMSTPGSFPRVAPLAHGVVLVWASGTQILLQRVEAT
jgi:hypothetical protein